MRRVLITLALVIAASTAGADEITKPIRYTWIATSCENWNCAAAALVMANGDKHVIALPTGVEDHPWLILRRVEEGSVFIPAEEPYGCEVFDTVNDASARFAAVGSCYAPLILNVPDGRAVVMSLKNCSMARRRAVR